MESATRIFHVPCARTERGIELSWGGRTYVFQPTTVDSTGATRRTHSGSLTAPMVGVVVEVMVEEGQRVEAYQPLAIVEAMKVMATVEAPFAGRVTKVHVRKGERVAHGAPVVDVAPD
ncbi:MAG TPA: biotin/lipoyl-containing protein [Chthonomonadales bacterium]|nr:biotin/lipoyl-containing protein [Chthonomonadales bacterium]